MNFNKRKIRIYIDTSVISMIDTPHIPEMEAITKDFFRLVAESPDKFELLISPVVIAEVANCPDEKRSKLQGLIDELQMYLASRNDGSRESGRCFSLGKSARPKALS